MAGSKSKKRSHQDVNHQSSAQRPAKKFRKQIETYDSDNSDENVEFKPVNLVDSDDDIDEAVVDDGGFSSQEGSDSNSEVDSSSTRQRLQRRKSAAAPSAKGKTKEERQSVSSEKLNKQDDGEQEEEDSQEEFDLGSDDDEVSQDGTRKKTKSKRNDPEAFSASLHKILGTKLPTTRRSDPLLSRSSEAHKASQALAESALEAKARRQLRQQKLLALEKGRVRDVLVASRDEQTGEAEGTTAELLEIEKKHRKTAQRGVIKLFNAVRAAQVQAADAAVKTRKEGYHGVKRREEKVTEMSKKGFLDLIAGGGQSKSETPA